MRPRLRNWSQSHIWGHLARCREYKDLYRDKLLQSPLASRDSRLSALENQLDAFNINFNRERAKLLADADKLSKAEGKGGWFGWVWGKGKPQREGGDLAKLDKAYQVVFHLHTCTPAHLHTCTPAHLHT